MTDDPMTRRVMDPVTGDLLGALPPPERLEMYRRLSMLDRLMSAEERGTVVMEWSRELLDQFIASNREAGVEVTEERDNHGFTTLTFMRKDLDSPDPEAGTMEPG